MRQRGEKIEVNMEGMVKLTPEELKQYNEEQKKAEKKKGNIYFVDVPQEEVDKPK